MPCLKGHKKIEHYKPKTYEPCHTPEIHKIQISANKNHNATVLSSIGNRTLDDKGCCIHVYFQHLAHQYTRRAFQDI